MGGVPSTPLKAWRDPSDGKWHRGVDVWRRSFFVALAFFVLYGGVLTVRGDWGNNPFAWFAAFSLVAAAFFLQVSATVKN